jgi:hypothetical protein
MHMVSFHAVGPTHGRSCIFDMITGICKVKTDLGNLASELVAPA